MSDHQPQLSAVVVTFQTGPVLSACLAALIKSPMCQEIILVNNGNPPEVVAQLVRQADQEAKLKLVDGHGNIGFGRGCNLGASHAQCANLAFVNPDCVIDEATLPAFAQTLAHHENALIGGALRNEDGSEQRGTRRGELTLWSALVSFLGIGRAGEAAGIWRDFNRTREDFPTETTQMPVVSGALMAIGKAHFEKLGGFDPAFFLHIEDIDLCRRVRESGGRVLFTPHATALHIGSTSATSSWVVEQAKIVSFARYFWKNAQNPLGYLSVILIMPMIALAIAARSLLVTR